MRLIVTEKNNSARKIAEILSDGAAKDDAAYKVPFYTWEGADGPQMTIGLKGHVLNPAFPEEYKKWDLETMHDLIDAKLIKEPTDKNVVKALKKVATDADSLIIATDFDREGELIGLEAMEEILTVNPELEAGVKRARYSALTKDEIDDAFNELDELSLPLAHAGWARQDVDLIWGATLTRAVSLSARRFGSNFLSVGRVQSPTLGLIVEREMERRAHVAEPYWEVAASFAHPDDTFIAQHTTDKFWKLEEAEAAVKGTASPGKVTEIKSRKVTRKPPTPLNTTAFTTDASNRLGITPSRAMRIAEDLYMDGFVSYPRTDNTVYPRSLPLKELVTSLVQIPDFSEAKGLLDGELTPTRGKKETTDHPPIHPAQAISPKAVENAHSETHRRVYELIARRFLATFSPPMITESTRADITAGSETYFVRGNVIVDAGFADIYTYARSADTEIPKLEEGQELELVGDPEMTAKETQPPPRIGQGKLIELMEERGLGTKATRADIIQKLYDRGYCFDNPPKPSETGIAMYEAFKNHVPEMATADMTAQLEADMDRIAEGETSKDDVVGTSRELLHKTYDEIYKSKDDLAKTVWAGMDLDKILGPCPECAEAGRKHEDGSPNLLRIIDTKAGKRFCGCQGYDRDNPESPDSCTFSRPLPGRQYEVRKKEPVCSKCGKMPRLSVKPFRGRVWELCLNEECPDMIEMKAKKAERLAAKEAKAAAKAAAENGDAKLEGEASATKVKRATRSKSANGGRSRGAKPKSKSKTKS